MLVGLFSALAWPAALLSVASVIDNPWSVCVAKAEGVFLHRQQSSFVAFLLKFWWSFFYYLMFHLAAGRELAAALMARAQGQCSRQAVRLS